MLASYLHLHECSAYCTGDRHAALTYSLESDPTIALVTIVASANSVSPIPIYVHATLPAEAPSFVLPTGETARPYLAIFHYGHTA